MKKCILVLSAVYFITVNLYSQLQIINFSQESTFGGEWIKDILVRSDGQIWFADDTDHGIHVWKDQQWSHLGSAQGFPDNVKALAGDSEGNIWIGTFDGLFRYDGISLTEFTTSDGLLSNNVNDIITNVYNDVFIATSGGLSVFSPDQTWNSFTTTEGLVSNIVYKLFIDDAMALWIGTAGGISKYDSGFTNYTTANGLVHDNVRAIAQDQAGDMWFGTLNGVSEFNGMTWNTFTTAEGLSNNSISDILADSKGNIWFASYTPNGGVTKFDGLSWPTYTVEHGLINNNTQTLAEDAQGNIWIGTGAGISRMAPDSWGYYGILNGLPDNTIFDVITDLSGNKWIATNNGLSKYDGSFTNYSATDGLPGNNCRALALDSEGHIWVATLNGAAKFESGQWKIYNADSGLVNNQVNDIVRQDESLWFITLGGLSLYDGKNYTRFTMADGLASDSNLHGLLDSQGNLWVGSLDNGVSRYDGTDWTVFNTGNGFLNNTVWDILEDKDHNIWFATNGGVVKFDGSTWETLTKDDGLPVTSILSLEQDDFGTLWFGTDSSQIALYNGTSFRVYSLTHKVPDLKTRVIREMNDTIYAGGELGLVSYSYKTAWANYSRSTMPGDSVESVWVDERQNVWIGTWGNGLGVLSDNKWSGFSQSDGLAGNFVYDITGGIDNHIWVATTNGVSRISEDTLVNFDNSNGLPGTVFYAVEADAAGNVWIGTNAGVSRYNGITFTSFSTTEGLPGNHVTAIHCGNGGEVWIGTTAGNGAAFFNGSTWTLYGTAQGLVNNNVYDICEDSEGNLWFATLGGVSMFDGVSFTNYPNTIYFGNTGLWAVLEDATGMIWACSWGRGAYVFNGKTWNRVDETKGIANDDVRDIALQQDGTVWLGTYGGGLSRITRGLCRYDSLSIQPVSCYDASDAVITLYPDLENMAYSIDGTTFVQDNEFSDISAGLYYPSVTNGFDTLFAETLILGSPEPIIVTLGNDTAICEGESVTLSAPFAWTYSWSNGVENEREIIVSEGGTYSVIVYDQEGCTGTDTVVVEINPLPAFDLGENIVWYSDDGPALMLDAGIDDVSYEWSTGESSKTIELNGMIMPEGVYLYKVTVEDANGCRSADSLTVTYIIEMGINDDFPGGLKIYPNPSYGKICLELKNPFEIRKIEIGNESGQIILIIRPESLKLKNEIDLSGYAEGTYFISIYSGNVRTVYKTVLKR